MAAHQAGFANVVASLGTALTAGQVELANRYAEAVALAYDVDLAGEGRRLTGRSGARPVVASGVIRITGRRPRRADPHDPDLCGQAWPMRRRLRFMQRAPRGHCAAQGRSG